MAPAVLLPIMSLFAPPPSWPPQYNLTLSTAVFPHWGPAGTHRYEMWVPTHPWGLVQLDGSVGQALCCWTGAHNGTCEATQAENARAIKAVSPNSRVFSYHNMLLGLGCFESQRDAMYDPQLADHFMRFANGSIYNNPTYDRGGGADPPQPGEDQYIWNYSTAAAEDWVVGRIPAALGPDLDGTFLDDRYFPEEHPQVVQALNMTPTDVTRYGVAQQAALARLLAALQAEDKAVYFQLAEPGAGIHWNGTDTAKCAAYLRAFCTPAWQSQAILVPISFISNVTMSIASFLLARGPIGFIGFGWPSDDFDWRPEFEMDVGVPTALCVEAPANRFGRPFTYGEVYIDCNDFTFAVPHG